MITCLSPSVAMGSVLAQGLWSQPAALDTARKYNTAMTGQFEIPLPFDQS